MDRQFRVDVKREGDGVVLALFGELDVASSRALESELQRLDASSKAVVDLRGLDFIDSTGLGVLVKAHQRLEHAGAEFSLIEGEGQVKRLFDLTGLSDQLRFSSSAGDAFTE